jgi:hypothetical protein
MLKISKLQPIPANENPFLHDHYHIGQDITSNSMVIVDSNKVEYLILIDTATGERHKINFKPEPDRAQFHMDILGARNGCLADNSVVEGSEVVVTAEPMPKGSFYTIAPKNFSSVEEVLFMGKPIGEIYYFNPDVTEDDPGADSEDDWWMYHLYSSGDLSGKLTREGAFEALKRAHGTAPQSSKFEGYVCDQCGSGYNCCEHKDLEDYTLVKGEVNNSC